MKDQKKVVSEKFDQLFPKEMSRDNSTHGHFLKSVQVLSAPQITAFTNAAQTFLEGVKNFELDSWASMPKILKELTPEEIDQLKTTLETPGPLREKMIDRCNNYTRCDFIEKQAKKIIAARGVKAE